MSIGINGPDTILLICVALAGFLFGMFAMRDIEWVVKGVMEDEQRNR